MPPNPRDSVVRVDGLRELVRAFQIASPEMAKDLKTALEQAGEPIRADATNLVFSEISGMRRGRLPWHEIRAGVAGTSIGYIVPARRRRVGPPRPKLAPRLLEPETRAVERNASRVFDEFDQAVGEMTRAWARV